MAKFLMLGKYSAEAVKGISRQRTRKVEALIKKYGGRFNSMYVLLGVYDLAFVAELAGVKDAMKFSVQLAKSTGISFTTSPCVTVEEFDRILG